MPDNNKPQPKPGDITLKGMQDLFAQTMYSFLKPRSMWGMTAQVVTKRDFAPKPPEPEVVVGYVEGWRWFNVGMRPTANPIEFYPVSTVQAYVWSWGENLAVDMTSNQSPKARLDMHGSDGFYAYKREHICYHSNANDDPPMIFGRIAMYGDVVEHEEGYRSEKARIIDLWCAESDWQQLSYRLEVRGTYTVDEPTILGIDGNPCGGYKCLRLENRRESFDSSLSAGQTTTMLIDRNLSRYQSPNAIQFPWTIPWESPLNPVGHAAYRDLWSEYCRPRIIRMSPLCSLCNGWVRDDDRVVVQEDWSGCDYRVLLEPDCKPKRELVHWDCMVKQMEPMSMPWMYGLLANNSPVYATYGSISRNPVTYDGGKGFRTPFMFMESTASGRNGWFAKHYMNNLNSIDPDLV